VPVGSQRLALNRTNRALQGVEDVLVCTRIAQTVLPKLPLREAESHLREILDQSANGSDVILTTVDGIENQISVTVHNTATRAKRIANLHPGSSEMSTDFDDELPASFWLGEE